MLGSTSKLLELRASASLRKVVDSLDIELKVMEEFNGEDVFDDLKSMLKHLRFIGATVAGTENQVTSSQYRQLLKNMEG